MNNLVKTTNFKYENGWYNVYLDNNIELYFRIKEANPTKSSASLDESDY